MCKTDYGSTLTEYIVVTNVAFMIFFDLVLWLSPSCLFVEGWKPPGVGWEPANLMLGMVFVFLFFYAIKTHLPVPILVFVFFFKKKLNADMDIMWNKRSTISHEYKKTREYYKFLRIVLKTIPQEHPWILP